jgi:alkaline phosphatase
MFKKTLFFLAAALLLTVSGCSLTDNGKGSDTTITEGESYLLFRIDSKGNSRMISTSSSEVEALKILVLDPLAEEIASLNWDADQGETSFKLPVEKIGEYTIVVTHISETTETEETATVMVAPMVISEIVIVPGFIGSVNIKPLEASEIKNIIVMISDGCGFYQLDAASLYQYGETGTQAYEAWPVNVAMSHYMYGAEYDPELAWEDFDYVRGNATDSAAAATTMSTGTKTYSGAIGKDMLREDLTHIAEVFEDQGKSTGVISSVEFSHATPAAFVAHNVSRNNYGEIAREMINSSATDVIMGAGHPFYDNNGTLRTGSPNYKYVGGEETWNSLVAGTAGSDADGDGVADPWTLIEDLADFRSLTSGVTPQRVIGIPQVYQTLQYNRSGDSHADAYAVPYNDNVPSLEEMTQGAINVLDNNGEGFFLMVEGGAVDWAGHGNASGRVIEEEIDFNRSVEAVIAWVEANSSWEETLVVVTGDHETGYLTGPGSGDGVWTPLVNNGAGNMPGMQWNSGSHTNALIPFFANGSGSELFNLLATDTDPVRGPYVDNSDLGNVMKFLVK